MHSPVLRATKFVGQSQGKQDRDKGFNQKEQKKVCAVYLYIPASDALTGQTINDFKEGKYNILVSTSIGEEGLDIGEVDFVVIYDMPKQSIKLVRGADVSPTCLPLETGFSCPLGSALWNDLTKTAATYRPHRPQTRRPSTRSHVRRP